MDKKEVDILNFNVLTYDKHFIEYFNNISNNEKLGVLHSVYSKTINFIDNNKRMYTIGTKKVDNSPYTMRLNTETLQFDQVLPKPKISLYKLDNNIVIDNKIKIDFNIDSKLWNRDIKPIKKLDKNIIIKQIEYFDSLILHKGFYGGCKYYYLNNYLKIINHNPTLIENELSKKIETFIYNVKSEMIDGEIIKSLIGFGMGLTPSGDDFITGFLSTINIISTNYTNKVKNELTSLIDINKISTTDVSKQMLFITLNGETREYILDFILSFLDENKENLLFSLNNLLSIGYSSGTDIAIGVVMAFITLVNNLDMEE